MKVDKEIFYPQNKYVAPLYSVDTSSYDYNDLKNLPKINNVTLTGNKTSDDLNIEKLPAVSQNDNGKFCIVSNGKWTPYEVKNAEGVEF